MIYTFLYPWLVEWYSGFNVLRYTSIQCGLCGGDFPT
jgi:hypothetical protein